jgi:FkbM family methyltransferase
MTLKTIAIFVVLFIFLNVMYSIIKKILYVEENTTKVCNEDKNKICNCNKNDEYDFYGPDHVSCTRNLNHHFYNRCKNHLFNNYEDSDEVPERLSAYLFIEPNDKVLEIGGNIGGVSAIISDKLISGQNLVVLEPSDLAIMNLRKLSRKHNFNVYHGAMVGENTNLECKLTHGNYFACNEVDYKVKNNITFAKLQEKYNIIFDTLVVDCEGCYENLFVEGFYKGWFKNIKKIIIEWDGKDLEKMILSQGFYFVSYLPHVNLEKGVRVYFKN